MKLRWMCSYTMGEDRIIRRICGNMASREAESHLTSAWGADAKGQKCFLGGSKKFYRPTAMSLTKGWAGRSWCMPDAGRTRGGSSSMRSSSTRSEEHTSELQ